MDLSVLRTAKAALDEGLIDNSDFHAVKSSFVKAQSIKAGVDAGVFTDADFAEVRQEFFRTIGIGARVASPQRLPAPTSSPAPPPAPVPTRAAVIPAPAIAAPVRPADVPRLAAAAAPAAVASSSHPIQVEDRTPTGGSNSNPPSESAASLPQTPRDIADHGGAQATAGKASMSGIKVHPDSVNVVGEMRIRKKYRWIVFKIGQEGKQVEVDQCGGPKSTYADFTAAMPEGECRYGVYDYEYRNSEGTIYGKLMFVSWAPEIAPMKAKMQHASTKDFFRGFLDGISVELHATEADELEEVHIRERVANTVARK